jgi:putative hydrolase of HD superfamily
MTTELDHQVTFLIEIDKLKGIDRRSPLVDRSRLENSAEHSWHAATSAAVLAPYAATGVDLCRVVRMLLVHDIVEIDAGDTFAYDQEGRRSQHEREAAAAARIFGLLPETQSTELTDLWKEFEAMETPDALFANAVDRYLPLLHNYYTEGSTWRGHRVTSDQVMQRMACVEQGAPALWPYVQTLIDDAVQRGYLLAD